MLYFDVVLLFCVLSSVFLPMKLFCFFFQETQKITCFLLSQTANSAEVSKSMFSRGIRISWHIRANIVKLCINRITIIPPQTMANQDICLFPRSRSGTEKLLTKQQQLLFSIFINNYSYFYQWEIRYNSKISLRSIRKVQ